MASVSDSGFHRSRSGTPYYVPGKKFPLYVPPGGYIRPGEDVPACMTPFDLSLRRPPSMLLPPDMWKSALPHHEIDNSREYPLKRRRPLPQPEIDNSRGVKTRPFDVEKERALERELLSEAFSWVSEEANESCRDSVKEFDPVEVAAKVESALFENLGARPVSRPHRAICKFLWSPSIKGLRREVLLGKVPLETLVRMSNEELEYRYPRDPCGLEENLYA